MSQYQIGSTIIRNLVPWRIVRVVTRDTTLFEDENGQYTITESYLQLKSIHGEIDHLVLESDKAAYIGDDSQIKGLDPIVWRPLNG